MAVTLMLVLTPLLAFMGALAGSFYALRARPIPRPRFIRFRRRRRAEAEEPVDETWLPVERAAIDEWLYGPDSKEEADA